MEKYEHIEIYSIKYCDVDFKDELKMSAVLSYLEEVACLSADELGFGYEYLKPKGYSFMVTNICCEFMRPIRLGEKVQVKTWPTPPSHVIFGREYQICDLNGDLLLNASSRWCLVDMRSGRIANAKVIDNQDYTSYNTSKAILDVKWKIPSFSMDEGELKFEFIVANSEYDHNMHVNNTRYADYCFNCFSVSELKDRILKRFLISYVKQCKEGEKLRFYRKPFNKNEYLILGVNENGETVIQAHIVFGE